MKSKSAIPHSAFFHTPIGYKMIVRMADFMKVGRHRI